MAVSEVERGRTKTQERAIRVLRQGGVLALPTETVYGLSCLAHSEDALIRIRRMKGITRHRGFVVLVSSFEAVERDLDREQDERAIRFLRQAWPAPLSAVVRVRPGLPWSETRGSYETAAYRLPAHPGLRRFLHQVGAPVVSTSANRTGEPPLGRADEIERVFGAELDWILREEWEPGRSTRTRRPSTLVDCTDWPPRVLRGGGFDLEAALRSWSGA